jgi:two-component system, sensor histidine kinase and response regulator
MGSIHRNTSPPSLSRLGWVAALRARLERSFGHTTPQARAGPSAPAAPAARASPVPNGLRILVADDDPSNLEVACALLERCGVCAQAAVDGVQAVALARVHDFDLILMDLQMPVLDGLAATMQIRAREKARSRPRVPVVAYTSVALGDDLLRACGIDGVLAKPCSTSALRECLRRWCGPDAGTLREAPAAQGVREPR